MQYGNRTEAKTTADAIPKEEGRYIYCVADAGEKVSLGEIGMEGGEVYTITYQDLCAVVHDCPPQPYKSGNQEVVKTWVTTHHKVVDAAWERWGTILPSGFDTIIKGETGSSGERNVQKWLHQEYEGLKRKMEKVRGKAEYGVQVLWDLRVLAQDLARTSPEISEREEEIKAKPRGAAYMYRQKLENLVKRAAEARADQFFRDFYQRISKHADDIRVEKIKEAEPGWQMLLNLSCLVRRDRQTELGEELDKINTMEGFSVRFTGPWPPYSFT